MEQLLTAYGGSDSEDDAPLGKPPGQSEPAALVQHGCPFKLGDRLEDEIFGKCVVIELPLASYAMHDTRMGSAKVKFDNETISAMWRTWGHLSASARIESSAAATAQPTPQPMSLSSQPAVRRAAAAVQPLARPPAAVKDGDRPPAPESAVKKQKTMFSFGWRGSGALAEAAGRAPAGATAGARVNEPAAGGAPTLQALSHPAMHPAIERPRAPKLKPASKGERTSSASTGEKKESTATCRSRIKEFPDAGFDVLNGLLWCSCCKTIVSAKHSSVKQHIATKKHADAAEARKRREQSDNFVIDDIGKFFRDHPEVVGSTVQVEEQHYRYRITESFLAAGIELTKADLLRPLLQRANFSSTHSSHLRSFVPLIEKHEVGRVSEELRGQLISVAYDGTRRIGEAINITARFCSIEFTLATRLICLVTAAKSYDAADLVQLINMVLLQHFMVQPSMVIGFSRDAVACNGLAMQTLSTIFGSSGDLPCTCHTLSHVGEKFEFDLLDEFMTPWYMLRSNKRKLRPVKSVKVSTINSIKYELHASIIILCTDAEA